MTHMTDMAESSALLGSMMAITLTRPVRYFIRTPDGRLHQEAKWLFRWAKPDHQIGKTYNRGFGTLVRIYY